MAKIIVIEGVDFVGKSTAIRELDYMLRNYCGLRVLIVREPGGCPEAEIVRDTIFKIGNLEKASRYQALLFNASREILLEEIVIPSLPDYDIIIYDRWFPTTYVYQGDYKGDLDYVRKLHDLTIGERLASLNVPIDCYVLTADMDVLEKRRSMNRENNSYDPKDLVELKKKVQAYLQLAASENWTVVSNNTGEAANVLLNATMHK